MKKTTSQSRPEKAIVLLSGGLDSTTTLAIAKSMGLEIHALSFNYGQRHIFELEAARKIANTFNVKQHLISTIDLGQIGGSALTSNLAVPKHRNESEMNQKIPITYVPARNTLFLAYALAWAETLAAQHIFIGVNALDYSGYPDCRPEYIAAFQNMADLATKASVQDKQTITIHTPLINLNKAEIIKKGLALRVDYSQTTSCYDPNENGEACGACDACLLRQKGFRLNHTDDPIRYQTQSA